MPVMMEDSRWERRMVWLRSCSELKKDEVAVETRVWRKEEVDGNYYGLCTRAGTIC